MTNNHVSTFHRQNRERLETYPHAMITTSTHDIERSEDVRARIRCAVGNPRCLA